MRHHFCVVQRAILSSDSVLLICGSIIALLVFVSIMVEPYVILVMRICYWLFTCMCASVHYFTLT